MAGNTVKWFTDNQSVKQIISVGSKRSPLQDGALAIFEVCFKHGIKLEVDWVPRSLNERADIIIRIINHDDRCIDGSNSRQSTLLGAHSRFASQENAKLPRFHSRFWSPGWR